MMAVKRPSLDESRYPPKKRALMEHKARILQEINNTGYRQADTGRYDYQPGQVTQSLKPELNQQVFGRSGSNWVHSNLSGTSEGSEMGSAVSHDDVYPFQDVYDHRTPERNPLKNFNSHIAKPLFKSSDSESPTDSDKSDQSVDHTDKLPDKPVKARLGSEQISQNDTLKQGQRAEISTVATCQGHQYGNTAKLTDNTYMGPMVSLIHRFNAEKADSGLNSDFSMEKSPTKYESDVSSSPVENRVDKKSVVKSHDIESQSHDSVSQSHDIVYQSDDSVSKSHDMVSQSHDSVSQSHDGVSQLHDSVSQSHDSVCQLGGDGVGDQLVGLYGVLVEPGRSGKDQEVYRCGICERLIKQKGHFLVHLRTHEEGNCRCRVCSAELLSLDKLQAHVKSHHKGDKPYKCEHCSREFSQYNNLRRHLRVHRGKVYKCELCERQFNEAFYLTMHMGTHTGQRVYSCGVCNACFGSGHDLKMHVKTHSPSQLHTCDVCGKSFSKACVLRQHKKGHTGDRPHKCDQCPKTFIHRHHLTMHLRSHSENKPYVCDICHKEFYQSSHLYKHLRCHEDETEAAAVMAMREKLNRINSSKSVGKRRAKNKSASKDIETKISGLPLSEYTMNDGVMVMQGSTSSVLPDGGNAASMSGQLDSNKEWPETDAATTNYDKTDQMNEQSQLRSLLTKSQSSECPKETSVRESRMQVPMTVSNAYGTSRSLPVGAGYQQLRTSVPSSFPPGLSAPVYGAPAPSSYSHPMFLAYTAQLQAYYSNLYMMNYMAHNTAQLPGTPGRQDGSTHMARYEGNSHMIQPSLIREGDSDRPDVAKEHFKVTEDKDTEPEGKPVTGAGLTERSLYHVDENKSSSFTRCISEVMDKTRTVQRDQKSRPLTCYGDVSTLVNRTQGNTVVKDTVQVTDKSFCLRAGSPLEALNLSQKSCSDQMLSSTSSPSAAAAAVVAAAGSGHVGSVAHAWPRHNGQEYRRQPAWSLPARPMPPPPPAPHQGHGHYRYMYPALPPHQSIQEPGQNVYVGRNPVRDSPKKRHFSSQEHQRNIGDNRNRHASQGSLRHHSEYNADGLKSFVGVEVEVKSGDIDLTDYGSKTSLKKGDASESGISAVDEDAEDTSVLRRSEIQDEPKTVQIKERKVEASHEQHEAGIDKLNNRPCSVITEMDDGHSKEGLVLEQKDAANSCLNDGLEEKSLHMDLGDSVEKPSNECSGNSSSKGEIMNLRDNQTFHGNRNMELLSDESNGNKGMTKTTEKLIVAGIPGTELSEIPRISRSVQGDQALFGQSVNGGETVRGEASPDKSEYECEFCEKRFSCREDLQTHTTSHRGNRPYVCNVCLRSFGHKHNLNRHKMSHNSKSFVCGLCQRTFKEGFYLQMHMKIHLEETARRCDICGQQVPKSQIWSHAKSHLGNILENPTYDEIGHRVKEILREQHVNQAVEPTSLQTIRHPLKKRFENGENCPGSRKLLTAHEMTENIENVNIIGNQCDRNHLKDLQNTPKHLSVDSEKYFQEIQGGVEDRTERSDFKPLQCQQCDLAFRTYREFVNHLGVHNGTRTHMCGVCGQGFKKKSVLRNHERVHQEEKSFTCSHCGANFQSYFQLQTHAQLHKPSAGNGGDIVA